MFPCSSPRDWQQWRWDLQALWSSFLLILCECCSALTRQLLGLGLRCQHFKLELCVLQALNQGAEMLYCVLSLSDSPTLALTMPRSLSENWKSLLAVTGWLHPAHVTPGCWALHKEPALLKGSGEKDPLTCCSQRLPALLQSHPAVFLGAGSVRKSHLLPAPGLILAGLCCELRLARPCELQAGISTLPQCCRVLSVTMFRVRNEGQQCWIASE